MRKFKLKALLLAAVLSAGALLAACGEEQAFPEGPEHLRVYIEGTEQYLVLQEPKHEFFRVENLLVDGKTGGYAVIYDTSDISGEIDPDFGKLIDETSHIEVQFFDKNGEYLNLLHTDLESHTNDDENFYDGMLSFNTSGFERHGRVIYDSKNDEYVVLHNSLSYTVKAFVFDGDITVVVGEEYDQERRLEIYHVDRYDRAVKTASASFENTDTNFIWAGFSHGDGESAFEFSAKDNTVTIASEKLSYFVDLNTGACTMQRAYTTQMLEDYLDTNAAGDTQLYRADCGGAGEGFWADLVLYEPASDKITYLGSIDRGAALFGQGEHVLVNQYKRLELINYRTTQLISDDFGGFTQEDVYINAIAWDAQLECYVITYFSAQGDIFWGSEAPDMMVATLSPSGEVLHSAATGLDVRLALNGGIRFFTLELHGDGTASVLYYDIPEGVITYN